MEGRLEVWKGNNFKIKECSFWEMEIKLINRKSLKKANSY
jgi:hypothetical protein